MRFFTFGDNPMRDYCVGVDDKYDFVAAKNIVNLAFGGGKELERPTQLKLLGVISPGPQGPTFVASVEEKLSPPSPSHWDRPAKNDKGPPPGQLF